jgi:uncharacterized protein involved in exopolysaccharide biosynthesis
LTLAIAIEALRRRWKLALALAVAAASVACFGGVEAAKFLPGNCTVRTLVQVAAARPTILYDPQDGRTDFAYYQRSQVAMIKSRFVLKAALETNGIPDLPSVRAQGSPLTWLESKVQADYSIAPEILRITLTGDQPDDLMVLLNAVSDAYLREYVNRDEHERQAQLDKLQGLCTQYEETVGTKRAGMR